MGPLISANATAKALCNIETVVSDWCFANVQIEAFGSSFLVPLSTLIADRACSCQIPSSGPPNDAPDNSGSDGDGSGTRGIWVWVAISGGLGLLLIAALLIAAVLRRRRFGPHRISCIPLDS